MSIWPTNYGIYNIHLLEAALSRLRNRRSGAEVYTWALSEGMDEYMGFVRRDGHALGQVPSLTAPRRLHNGGWSAHHLGVSGNTSAGTCKLCKYRTPQLCVKRARLD